MDVREKLVDVHGKLMGLLQRAPYIRCEDVHRQYAVNWFMNNGVTVQQWISVKERLPQDDLPFGALCEIVQVLLDDGTVTVGWCNRGLKCWYYMPIQATNFVGHNYDKTPVIAWQPLSQPPKGE